MSFTIHLLVPDKAGPIGSAPGGNPIPIGKRGRWRIACDGKLTMNEIHRGTHEWWAVYCAKCMATPEFKEISAKYPHPKLAESPDIAVSNLDRLTQRDVEFVPRESNA